MQIDADPATQVGLRIVRPQQSWTVRRDQCGIDRHQGEISGLDRLDRVEEAAAASDHLQRIEAHPHLHQPPRIRTYPAWPEIEPTRLGQAGRRFAAPRHLEAGLEVVTLR